MTAHHQHEREQVRPPRVDPRRRDDDPERLQQGARHGHHVAAVGDPAEIVAQRPSRLGALVEAIGRQHVGQCLGRRDHRALRGGGRHLRHAADVTLCARCDQCHVRLRHRTAAGLGLAHATLDRAVRAPRVPPAEHAGRATRSSSRRCSASPRERCARRCPAWSTAGELQRRGGAYELTGRLLDRQSQQDAGRVGPPTTWDGTWWVVVVTTDRRTVAERREFRSRALAARLGELRPEVWLRPANIDIPRDLGGVAITRGPLEVGDEHELVERLWDLDALAARARGLTERLEQSGDAPRGRRATGAPRHVRPAGSGPTVPAHRTPTPDGADEQRRERRPAILLRPTSSARSRPASPSSSPPARRATRLGTDGSRPGSRVSRGGR